MPHAYVIALCDEVAELLGVVLKRRGMTADFFLDGEVAVGALRADPARPDAIIVGCVPPLVGGQRHLLEAVAALSPQAAARTIVLTDAPDHDGVVKGARALGIPFVFPMPFDLDELGRALDRLDGGSG